METRYTYRINVIHIPMELSLFLAKILGAVFTAFSVAGLMRPKIISDALRDFDHESFARLIAGCAGIGVGIAVILQHNVWAWDYRGLITLFGWTALLKGVSYLLIPKQAVNFTKSMMKSKSQMQVFLGATLLIGLYLLYSGFGY
jgi:hypothetical protein